MKKYKIKHKTEGWTGTLEAVSSRHLSQRSHACAFTVTYVVSQDAYKPDGTYVEDPFVESLDELEIEGTDDYLLNHWVKPMVEETKETGNI